MRSLIALDVHGGDSFVEALLRIWEDGDAVMPFDSRAPLSHRRRILQRMRPSAIEEADGRRFALAGGVPVGEDDAVVITTSGTTGEPKGVIHTHASVAAAGELTGSATRTTTQSYWLACLPLTHIGGFSVITRAIRAGAGLAVIDGFDAGTVDAALDQGATHVSLVPTVLPRIRAQGWQVILLGGSAIPPQRPANSIATYGMTETFGGVVYDGHALDGVEVRVDADSRIGICSPTLFRGYRHLTTATTPADGNPSDRGSGGQVPDTSIVDAEGFFWSGDMGSFDPATDTLTVHGRADDLIVSGGVKVWPSPVEEIIGRHPRVRECVVVGTADPEWGQQVTAVVVPLDHVDLPSIDSLRDMVKMELPPAHAPRRLVVVDDLPRTTSGKIRRADALSRSEGTYHH